MIEAKNLTKKYVDKTAVEDLTFTVQPGIVTGFLGPNGAGKSTTMRMILGLDAPTSGTVTVREKPYRSHATPLQVVGALLEALDQGPAQEPRRGRAHRLHLQPPDQRDGPHGRPRHRRRPGRLRADMPMSELIAQASSGAVVVRCLYQPARATGLGRRGLVTAALLIKQRDT
jgi:energy-coupling factor transporter ATP-binding protein EcfA2